MSTWLMMAPTQQASITHTHTHTGSRFSCWLLGPPHLWALTPPAAVMLMTTGYKPPLTRCRTIRKPSRVRKKPHAGRGCGQSQDCEDFFFSRLMQCAFLSWSCFIKACRARDCLPPVFPSSNHQSVSDSFPDQSEEDRKGCCVPEVSSQLARQSHFPTPPINERGR